MYISLCISLVLGELTPSQYTDMPCMDLGESLTAVGYAQPAMGSGIVWSEACACNGVRWPD